MRKCQPKHQESHLAFPTALKSFMGYLEGTQKAAHTIKNYRLDLLAFEQFLARADGERPIRWEGLGPDDLNRYSDFLQGQGFKTNTRRRKLLTAQRFLRYLSQRNKLDAEMPTKMPAPHKIERIPFTVPQGELLATIRSLPLETPLDRRNRALLWVLAETGCLVSEASSLLYEDWKAGDGDQATLLIRGKSERKIRVSSALHDEILALRDADTSSHRKWIFLGHNKHGSLGAPITPRGIELLVRHYADRLGFPELTPRTFRHSAVIAWFEAGLTQSEIQLKLGLKSAYAFRTYSALMAKDQ